MKMLEKEIENKEVTQVFISKQEAEDDNIKKIINELKKGNKNIVVFVSGINKAEETLKVMLQFMQNKIAV